MTSKRVIDLVERLGTTDAVARELIDIGESALATVDACAAAPARPVQVRRAASLVAHHIRERMMRGPAAPGVESSAEAVEAREWLAQGRRFGGDSFQRHDAREFVDRLYQAGAAHVTIGAGGDIMIVQLPEEPAARQRLFAIYNTEVDELGEEFGGEDTRGHEMTLEEARAIGAPEAVGEWVVDDLHVHDSGQTVLRFCWD